MARARTKQELIDFGEKELTKLEEYVKHFRDEANLEAVIFDNRTLKDVLAHLVAWDELFIDWYDLGMKGEQPQVPAPGYTFKTVPLLNEKLYLDYKDVAFDEILNRLRKKHQQILEIIKKHSDEELFEKKKYKWTGSTSLGSYLASVLPSHYVWANELIKKQIKK